MEAIMVDVEIYVKSVLAFMLMCVKEVTIEELHEVGNMLRGRNNDGYRVSQNYSWTNDFEQIIKSDPFLMFNQTADFARRAFVGYEDKITTSYYLGRDHLRYNVLEHHMLYPLSGSGQEKSKEYFLQVGKKKIQKYFTDLPDGEDRRLELCHERFGNSPQVFFTFEQLVAMVLLKVDFVTNKEIVDIFIKIRNKYKNINCSFLKEDIVKIVRGVNNVFSVLTRANNSCVEFVSHHEPPYFCREPKEEDLFRYIGWGSGENKEKRENLLKAIITGNFYFYLNFAEIAGYLEEIERYFAEEVEKGKERLEMLKSKSE